LFLEYSTHGHAYELSSMLKRLLDGINRQPTETRAKLSVVRFWSHDKLRSSLYCLMVANVMSTISTVDDKVNDAIWVIRKLLQGVVKFVVIRTRLRVECIEVMNLPFVLVDKNSPYSSYIGSGKGGEGSASYQLGSSEIMLSREVGSQSSSLVQRTCGSSSYSLSVKGCIVMYGKPRLTLMGMT
jgi:hypothetical protein